MKPTDEMTRTILKMEKNRIPQISLVWITILLTASGRSENIPRITNLECFNDFHERIFCSWKVVNSHSNCSEDFALSYTDYKKTKEKCRDLRNEQFGDSVVPNKCICNIPVKYFTVAESYAIEVESYGEPVGNTIIHIVSTIKPRAPLNVRVVFHEEQNGVVQWDTGYTSSIILDNLSFHVQIICKHSREVALQQFLTQTTPKYHFSKKQLKRGENYVVRVRAMSVQNPQGAWSEWSSEAEWRNDYSLTILDLMDIIIPITCIVILCLLIGCYACFTRCKKTWWDTIPSPAKSTFVKKKLIQKHRSFPDGKCDAKKSCGSFFSRIVKAHKSKCDQFTWNDTARQYVIGIVSSDCKKFIFEPKNEDIERCVEMYPKTEDENNPVLEDKPEHKAEDHSLEDLSIANMFSAILHDSSSIKVDTSENLNAGLFGCPGLMDSFDEEEKQRLNSNVSGNQKLGYHDYDSDDSPLDSSSSLNVVNMLCFDQWPDNEIDCIPYTSQDSMKGNCSYQGNGTPLASPGYNSFANALYEAKQDFIINTTKTFCLDNISQSTVLGKTNIYERHLIPRGILYYNTKHFSLLSKDSFQPNIEPKSGQFILQCHEGKTDPTFIHQVSGYQSIDQAGQENEPELGYHMSGYKSFDQAVQQGDETSVSEVYGYQSFDRAVQENHLEFGCNISGYKSFDQAVQEGVDTSVCEVNGYQTFDEAVQESETSGSSSCFILDSGYKPFESLICQNNDYSDKNGCMCKNDHCKNNTNFNNSQEYKLISSGSMELSDSVKPTMEKYPSCSDKPFKALKIAVGTNFTNDMALKHEGIPLMLTFDIGEHLRNLENKHGHKVPLDNLEIGTIPINYAIFPCHLDKVSFTQEQLTSGKNLIVHKCPSKTYTSENMSFFKPLFDLDDLDPSETTKHLLIQQSSLDKDGNSYMKIK